MRQVAASRPVTGLKMQPSDGSQESAVQGSPSSQVAIGGLEQVPVAGSQKPARWQASCAVQTTGSPPMQTPAWQVSVWEQALPSSHAVPSAFGVASHRSAASLHVPSLHWSAKAEQSRA